MDLEIVHNPHREPKDAQVLFDNLMEQRRRLYGIQLAPEKLDRAALNDFKKLIQDKSISLRAK